MGALSRRDLGAGAAALRSRRRGYRARPVARRVLADKAGEETGAPRREVVEAEVADDGYVDLRRVSADVAALVTVDATPSAAAQQRALAAVEAAKAAAEAELKTARAAGVWTAAAAALGAAAIGGAAAVATLRTLDAREAAQPAQAGAKAQQPASASAKKGRWHSERAGGKEVKPVKATSARDAKAVKAAAPAAPPAPSAAPASPGFGGVILVSAAFVSGAATVAGFTRYSGRSREGGATGRVTPADLAKSRLEGSQQLDAAMEAAESRVEAATSRAIAAERGLRAQRLEIEALQEAMLTKGPAEREAEAVIESVRRETDARVQAAEARAMAAEAGLAGQSEQIRELRGMLSAADSKVIAEASARSEADERAASAQEDAALLGEILSEKTQQLDALEELACAAIAEAETLKEALTKVGADVLAEPEVAAAVAPPEVAAEVAPPEVATEVAPPEVAAEATPEGSADKKFGATDAATPGAR